MKKEYIYIPGTSNFNSFNQFDADDGDGSDILDASAKLGAAAVGGSTAGIALGDAAKDGATGAAIGSIIPGVGTAIGGGVGAVIGAIIGVFGNNDKSAWNVADDATKEKLIDACIYKSIWVNKINPWDTAGVGGVQQDVFNQMAALKQFKDGQSSGDFWGKNDWAVNHICVAMGKDRGSTVTNKALHDAIWLFCSGQSTTAPPFSLYNSNYTFPPLPGAIVSNPVATPTTPTPPNSVTDTTEKKPKPSSTAPKVRFIDKVDSFFAKIFE